MPRRQSPDPGVGDDAESIGLQLDDVTSQFGPEAADGKLCVRHLAHVG
ncbi:MAG: hypothetical protein ACOC4E_00790 [Patescibacteria group bacterium]